MKQMQLFHDVPIFVGLTSPGALNLIVEDSSPFSSLRLVIRSILHLDIFHGLA
jgi:hypothetical protein